MKSGWELRVAAGEEEDVVVVGVVVVVARVDHGRGGCRGCGRGHDHVVVVVGGGGDVRGHGRDWGHGHGPSHGCGRAVHTHEEKNERLASLGVSLHFRTSNLPSFA